MGAMSEHCGPNDEAGAAMEKADKLGLQSAVIRDSTGEGSMPAAAKLQPVARAIITGKSRHPAQLLSARPTYRTGLGASYAADALSVLQALPDQSVNAVITSPPYALHFKKEYGNVDKQSYVQWMLPF